MGERTTVYTRGGLGRKREGGERGETVFYKTIPRAHLVAGLLLLTPEAASQLRQPVPLGTRGPPWSLE